jgi:hypothetical protein
MELRDAASIYGALLSTMLAAREIWKHRRSTRPKLIVHVNNTPTRRITASIGGSDISTGDSNILFVHNAGGERTKIEKAELCIASRWVPGLLLGLLGSIGRVPTVGQYELRSAGKMLDPTDDLLPGHELQMRRILWDEHREALSKGRLMLAVVHRYSRERMQQVRVKRSL